MNYNSEFIHVTTLIIHFRTSSITQFCFHVLYLKCSDYWLCWIRFYFSEYLKVFSDCLIVLKRCYFYFKNWQFFKTKFLILMLLFSTQGGWFLITVSVKVLRRNLSSCLPYQLWASWITNLLICNVYWQHRCD